MRLFQDGPNLGAVESYLSPGSGALLLLLMAMIWTVSDGQCLPAFLLQTSNNAILPPPLRPPVDPAMQPSQGLDTASVQAPLFTAPGPLQAGLCTVLW